MKNGGAREVRVLLEVSLEDEDGNVILSCNRAKNLDPDEDDDTSCPNTGLYLRDWPRVKIFHLKATIGKR